MCHLARMVHQAALLRHVIGFLLLDLTKIFASQEHLGRIVDMDVHANPAAPARHHQPADAVAARTVLGPIGVPASQVK